MGARAASSWQSWLQWRYAMSFGQRDPQFHRDISYYLFVYPLHRLVLTLLFRIVATSIVVVLRHRIRVRRRATARAPGRG